MIIHISKKMRTLAKMKRILFTLLALLAMASLADAKITLPTLVGDNMVLQRNTQVKIWGSTNGSSAVNVVTSWNGATYKAKPAKDGSWCVLASTPEAGGPYTISISDSDNSLQLSNILIGEVWICSGQSNMEMTVGGWEHQRVQNAFETIMGASSTPLVRMFTVQRNPSDTPQEGCIGEWQTSTPEAVRNFSATGYFFGKALSAAMPNMPIGLIASYWGGTPIEAWMSSDALCATEGINLERSKNKRAYGVNPYQLFNGMIYPLRNFVAKGFIWYQGEANIPNYEDYAALSASMVKEWRTLWGNEDMPFYLTQIAPYRYEDPLKFGAALLVEQQYRIPSIVAHSGVAPTTDLGHRDCIHPPYKKEVGDRLAYLALTNDYGFSGLPQTPVYKAMKVEDGRVRISFSGVSGAGNSLMVHGPRYAKELVGFEVAGADRVFYPATAQIDWNNSDVIVSAAEVPNPVAVRYAFHNWTDGANVCNDYGIPLPPFRTDSWEIPYSEL